MKCPFQRGDTVTLTASCTASTSNREYIGEPLRVHSVMELNTGGWLDFKALDGKISTVFSEDYDKLTFFNGEEIKPVGRRTFILNKDTPTMVKGALLQEQCDDGTQPYVMLNRDTHCKDPSFKVSIAKRELVEDQPVWFTEVFKVTPEYMTAAELTVWEAFKKAATPAKRQYNKKVKGAK